MFELASVAILTPSASTTSSSAPAPAKRCPLTLSIRAIRLATLPPLDHPDPSHCHVTGTGLTHLGSAKNRDAMHEATAKMRNISPTP